MNFESHGGEQRGDVGNVRPFDVDKPPIVLNE
jgi:hypothetical protein